ncbi:hypothetical protein V8C34DRAFT_158357 [Trichoderma compactum]
MHSVVVTMIWLVPMAVSISRLIHQIAIIPIEDVMTYLMEGEIIQQRLHAAQRFETNGAPISSQLGSRRRAMMHHRTIRPDASPR